VKGDTLLRVGLTGGLASGKSFVGDTLVELGCHLLKADEVGHHLLLPGGRAVDAVVREFGPEVQDAQGGILRPALAALVFGKPDRLQVLNQIVHPLVFEEEERFLDDLVARDPKAIAVVEAAILIESGNYRNFDKIVVAWCPREMQIERAVHRGLSREAAEARIAHQLPLEEKLSYADAVVDTSGSKEETYERVIDLHRQLLAWVAAPPDGCNTR